MIRQANRVSGVTQRRGNPLAVGAIADLGDHFDFRSFGRELRKHTLVRDLDDVRLGLAHDAGDLGEGDGNVA